MVVADQVVVRYANNKVVLEWDGIEDEDAGDGSLIDLTGRIVKFALTRFANGEPVATPELSFSSDDVSPRVEIPNPNPSAPDPTNPHVRVTIDDSDTVDLAPSTTDFYFELEVFEADGTDGVVVSTATLTLKPNVGSA